jgi:DNA invertase Pin-like site-specific DNA recombinase
VREHDHDDTPRPLPSPTVSRRDLDDERDDEEWDGPSTAMVYRRVNEPGSVGSLDEQLELCRRYAAEHGLRLRRDAVTDIGPASFDLPGLASLLTSGLDAVVVCASLDRLGDSPAMIAAMVEAITDDGETEVHTVHEGFRSPDHAGILHTLATAEALAVDDRTEAQRDADAFAHQVRLYDEMVAVQNLGAPDPRS